MTEVLANAMQQRFALPSMGDEQFDRWVRFLERRTGVVVPPTRREFLITNLRGRMRETGHANFDTYYDTLQNGAKGAIEWATLVDRLTVHQTHFFRHQPSFDYVVNQWLEQRKHNLGRHLACMERGLCDWRRSLFIGDGDGECFGNIGSTGLFWNHCNGC
jgi:CheR methyltransferase, all-alpha domain